MNGRDNGRKKSKPSEEDRPAIAFNFEQIQLKSPEHQALAKLDNRQLARLAHDHEMAAAAARYALWRRNEEHHAKN